MYGIGMESASFVESRSGLQTFHLCFCPTNKDEFVRIVFKGGKRKGMVGTAYGGFGQKAAIAHHLIAFDAVTEFFYRSSGCRYPVED